MAVRSLPERADFSYAENLATWADTGLPSPHSSGCPSDTGPPVCLSNLTPLLQVCTSSRVLRLGQEEQEEKSQAPSVVCRTPGGFKA